MNSNWTDLASMETDTEAYTATGRPQSELVAGASAEREKTFDDGRREGIEEGRRIERLDFAARIEQCEKKMIEQAARLNEQCALERDRFIHALEPEIVKLALNVAERILRREVQVDPLILTGAIRVALGQLADNTAARIRVPGRDAELWNETLAHLPNLRVRPAVIADEELQPGECRIESNLGSLDLSVQSQLQEIARTLVGNAEPGIQRPNLSIA